MQFKHSLIHRNRLDILWPNWMALFSIHSKCLLSFIAYQLMLAVVIWIAVVKMEKKNEYAKIKIESLPQFTFMNIYCQWWRSAYHVIKWKQLENYFNDYCYQLPIKIWFDIFNLGTDRFWICHSKCIDPMESKN